jgi:hypothetical protein
MVSKTTGGLAACFFERLLLMRFEIKKNSRKITLTTETRPLMETQFFEYLKGSLENRDYTKFHIET